MTWAAAVVAIIATVVLFSGISRRLNLSAPLLLTVAGIVVGWLPIVEPITIPAEVILLGFLPPLLYSMAIKTSLIDLKTHVRGIALLSIGHVLVVAIGVGLLLWWQLHIPLPLALAFGGVVAPPDAVAATTIAKNIGMPKKLVTLLEGESLFNDATALVLVRMGILALASGVTVWHVGLQFLWAAGGGIGLGIMAYWLIAQVRKLMTASVDDTALSFICPWIAYLPAEALHSSGVLATVMCGVLLGHHAYTFQDAQSRLSERTTWRAIQFILENAVFFLVGLQAFGIFTRVQRSYGIDTIVPVALLTLCAVILIRALYIFATMPLWRLPGMSRHEAVGEASILSWAGMRGVVTLAAVLSIPISAPHRDLLVLLALVVVAGTLLIQGATLPIVARTARLAGDDPRESALQRAILIERVADTGEGRLLELVDSEISADVVSELHARMERRRHSAWERLSAESDAETPSDSYRRLRLEMLQAERTLLLKVRDKGLVDSETLAQALGDCDVEEAMLSTLVRRKAAAMEKILSVPEYFQGDCEHLRLADDDRVLVPLTPDGCADCLDLGEHWESLRICVECGHVGCCDLSAGQHAAAHFAQTGHPVMRSFEPGEDWRWCYIDSIPG